MNTDTKIQWKIACLIQQHNKKRTLSSWGLFQKCKDGSILHNLLGGLTALLDSMKKNHMITSNAEKNFLKFNNDF